jgi:hypothetical protein
MRRLLAPTAAAVLGGATVALASGGPPPTQPPDPPPYTVVAHGVAQAPVLDRSHRTDASVHRAVSAARARAVPIAMRYARADADALAKAAGLTLGAAVGVSRQVAPPGGYYSEEAGQFGAGRWCGRLYVRRRTVRRPDGTTRRVAVYRQGCRAPSHASANLAVTFAATPR